jgi:hypothetical protein
MILEKHQFSPLNDLEKNDDSGLLRLADKKNFGRPELVAHIEALERDIVAYFKSRNEDNNIKGDQIQRPPPVKTKPFVAAKTQPHRGGAMKPPSRSTGGSNRPHIWSSGPSGTHVDDDNPYWNQCCCPGHHHQPGNHHCPCSPDYTDGQHGLNPSEHGHHHHHHHGYNPDTYSPTDEHHHHHHDNEHHHHGYNPDTCLPTDEHHHDNFGGHHSSHGHEQHSNWSNTDNSGYNYEHSSGGGGGGYDYQSGGGGGYDYQGGGGYGNTDYGGPGSFY